jgi:hypothetical protein
MEDTGQWGFLVLLILIIGPLLFWIVSLLISWVRWLFFDKEKLNASYATMQDFRIHLSNNSKFYYELGKDTNVEIKLLNEDYSQAKLFIKDFVNKGRNYIEFDSTLFDNGVYFCELITDNQKTIKRLIIEN